MNETYILMANSFHKLLSSLDWNDETLISGLKEGLNKFLSNAYLNISKKHKYLLGDFYSPKALEKVKSKDYSDLVFEHMVPKSKYIQDPCIYKAKQGTLTPDFVNDLLLRYWKIAIITKDEDSLLTSRKMPDDWDKINVFYRYQLAAIKLIQSPWSSEESWTKMTSFIENHDPENGSQVHNTNGQSGNLIFKNHRIAITTSTKTYTYTSEQNIQTLQQDGWYF